MIYLIYRDPYHKTTLELNIYDNLSKKIMGFQWIFSNLDKQWTNLNVELPQLQDTNPGKFVGTVEPLYKLAVEIMRVKFVTPGFTNIYPEDVIGACEKIDIKYSGNGEPTDFL